jgi:hypothetical protein
VNLSYSEERSGGSWFKASPRDPRSKKPITHKKRAGGVAQGVGPEFKSQYHHQKKMMTMDFFGGGVLGQTQGLIPTKYILYH